VVNIFTAVLLGPSLYINNHQGIEVNILSEVIIPLSGVVFPAVVAFIRAVYNRWGKAELHRDSQFDKVNVEKRLATFRRINQLKNKTILPV
jgi:hypothetical protein